MYDSVEELKERNLYEQIHVLSLRHHLRDRDIASLSGSDMLEQFVEVGGLSTKLMDKARFGSCVFDDKRKLCFVQLYDERYPTKNRVTCLQENGEWRVHLPGMEKTEAKSYHAIMGNKDISEDELLRRIVNEWTSDSEVELWQPLGQVSSPNA